MTLLRLLSAFSILSSVLFTARLLPITTHRKTQALEVEEGTVY